LKLSVYPFPEGLRSIRQYAGTRTSDLLARGMVVGMAYPGVPVYTPIGERVLGRIERHIEAKFVATGFDLIRIPSIIKTSDLADGEDIGDKFATKFMHLRDPSSGFHLLTTPEMMLIRTIGPTFSHSQLPIRVCYTADFFRNAADLKPLLVGRQFRIFGALGFELNEASAVEAIGLMEQVLRSSLADFGIPVRVLRREDQGFEMFFLTPEGDYRPDRLDADALPDDQRLLSLGMAYRYGKGLRLPARMRTADNRNSPLCFTTFGLCTNRLLFSAFDAGRTPAGFRLPAMLRPFGAAVIPRTREQQAEARDIVRRLEDAGLDVALDDRYKLPRTERENFAKMLGIPTCVVIENGSLQLCSNIVSNEARATSVDEIIQTALHGARS
jgi:prolyl-tRNA synthetase